MGGVHRPRANFHLTRYEANALRRFSISNFLDDRYFSFNCGGVRCGSKEH